MKQKSVRIRLATVLAVSVTCSLAQETWSGLGADNLWSTDDNWADVSAPSGAVAGALTFSGTTGTTNTNDISGLSFTSLVLNNSAWNISGNGLSLSGGITIGAGTLPTVSNDLTLTAASTIQTQNTLGGILTLSGSFTATGLEIKKDGGGSGLVFNGNGKAVSMATLTLRKGNVSFTNGVSATCASVSLGTDATASGTNPSISVSGTGTSLNATTSIQVGMAANDARLNVSGGAVTTPILLTGQSTSTLQSSGVYQSGGTINATNLRAGNNGASTIEVSGGIMNVLKGNANSTSYGLTQAGTSVMTISNGAVTIGSDDSQKWNLAASTGSGTLNLNGGTLSVFGFNKQNTTGTTTINLNGGTLKSLGNTTTWLNDLTNTDVNIGDGGVIIDSNGFTFTIAEPLLANGTGGLTKNSGGELTLNGACTYTGNTIINAGVLKLGSAGSIATSPLIDVKAGAIFKTTDTVPANVTSFTMTAGQPFKITLDPAAGGTAGRIDAEALDISAGVVDFATVGTLNDSDYVIANHTTLTGSQFAMVTNLPAGYTINYTHNSGTQIALVAGIVPGYAGWATANGITGALPGADFDADGISNLVEYALGKNPTVSDLPPGTFNGGTLTFTKGADALANGDVAYAIEESDDLGIADPWADVVASEVGNTISYTLPTGKPRVFARLKAVLITP